MNKVSVIISAYNCEDYVEEAIQSILNQTYQNLEIIIADDGSSDNTRHVIDNINDNRIKRYHNERNIGLLRTWNKLIPLTTGDYVTWQDADDISYPSRIQKLVAALDADSELALCGSNFCRPFHKWKMITLSSFPTSHNEIIKKIEQHECVPFPGTRSMIRRNILLEFPPFREFFTNLGWEDYDLFCRVAEKYKVANIADILYEYRYYPQSASKINPNKITARKIFIQDIGFYLCQQRRDNYGIDGLMLGGNKKDLDQFLNKMDNKLKENPFLPLKKIILNKISNKDYKNALIVLRQLNQIKTERGLYCILLYKLANSVFKSFVFLFIQNLTGNYEKRLSHYRNNVQ